MKQAHAGGGFLAVPGAPLPDLLSTATALHALESLQTNWQVLREPSLDFVDSLWNAEGGFHGHWADDDLDVEYTSYGLLALGHLSS
ncbi:prenyltransferase/squalene oxidase repeat-containing protein [Verrucomicrobium spinosum]|nr:prenyltransferase/squalene oxidase repeat-containing protein [Verrucomicrobium spinosum]